MQFYQASFPDWRTALKKNRNRTIFVVFLFVLIYLCLGFIIDLYLYTPVGTQIDKSAKALITFQIMPMASLIMLTVATISLLITYFFHRSLMLAGTDYHEVTADSTEYEEKQLYNIIEELKIASSLRFMPKVYVMEADYMNAFASGFSEKSAMVAITRGLLQKLDRSELQAVMAHEISHIRHNDIRLTLTVALLSNLIVIAIDLVFRGVLYTQSGRSRNNGLIFIIFVLRFLLPIVTLLLMLYLSRTREYMADAGAVETTRDNEPLARALIKIDEDSKAKSERYQEEYASNTNEDARQTAYFYDPGYAGIHTLKSINSLFSTHPSLEDRLKALGYTQKDL